MFPLTFTAASKSSCFLLLYGSSFLLLEFQAIGPCFLSSWAQLQSPLICCCVAVVLVLVHLSFADVLWALASQSLLPSLGLLRPIPTFFLAFLSCFCWVLGPFTGFCLRFGSRMSHSLLSASLAHLQFLSTFGIVAKSDNDTLFFFLVFPEVVFHSGFTFTLSK